MVGENKREEPEENKRRGERAGTLTSTRRAKTPNPLRKQTSALRRRIVSFVNTPINSNHTSHNSTLPFTVHAQKK